MIYCSCHLAQSCSSQPCCRVLFLCALSFPAATKTTTSFQARAWGRWHERARTRRTASWPRKPGLFSRSTTNPWRKRKSPPEWRPKAWWVVLLTVKRKKRFMQVEEEKNTVRHRDHLNLSGFAYESAVVNIFLLLTNTHISGSVCYCLFVCLFFVSFFPHCTDFMSFYT